METTRITVRKVIPNNSKIRVINPSANRSKTWQEFFRQFNILTSNKLQENLFGQRIRVYSSHHAGQFCSSLFPDSVSDSVVLSLQASIGFQSKNKTLDEKSSMQLKNESLIEKSYLQTNVEEIIVERAQYYLFLFQALGGTGLLSLIVFYLVPHTSTGLNHRLFNNVMVGAVIFIISIIFSLFILRTTIWKESLLIIPLIGIQISQTSALGTTHFVRFIPASALKSVIINETIKMQHVITYLAVVTQPSEKGSLHIYPIFCETLPRIFVLEEVYKRLEQIFIKIRK